ncbi:MAG: ABC transporter permease [Gemmatimonadaceae bacterium]|jgi:peptide/nickel transport system permease protein|nr:ABC transporter permease [Gemmatimonadaceae bacterium]
MTTSVTPLGDVRVVALEAPRPRSGPARLLAAPGTRLALGALLTIAMCVLVLPLVLPHAPHEQLDLATRALASPRAAHPFGTDAVARDVLARVVAGGRVSLAVAAASVLLASALGTAWGLAAGLAGARIDALLMRLVDAGLAVPRVLLLLVVLSLPREPSLVLLVLALGATGWFGVARLVRTEVRRLRDADWVLAARALGTSRRRLAWRQLLPHVLAPVLVTAALGMGNVIVLEAGLSWLGVGVQPPRASWGNIIRDGTDLLQAAPWISLAPGACLVLVVLCCTVLADGLRDALAARELPRP